MPRCFWVTLTDVDGKDMPHEFWKTSIKGGKETTFKKPRIVIPMDPGTNFKIKVRVEPDAWHYHKEDWYCARLNIDGEFARERFFPRSAEGHEWIFDTWKSGHRFKVAHRTSGSVAYEDGKDSDVGKIEVEFYPARTKYQDELQRAEHRYFDSQKEENKKVASRDVDMSANHFENKFHNSTLRTTKGDLMTQRKAGRARFGAPAKVLDNVQAIGRMVLYYDTPHNLRDRRVLQPALNKDHRQYFKGENFMDQMRNRRQQERVGEKIGGKRRLIADLTDDTDLTFVMEDTPVKSELGGSRSRRATKRQRTAAKAEKDESGNVVILD